MRQRRLMRRRRRHVQRGKQRGRRGKRMQRQTRQTRQTKRRRAEEVRCGNYAERPTQRRRAIGEARALRTCSPPPRMRTLVRHRQQSRGGASATHCTRSAAKIEAVDGEKRQRKRIVSRESDEKATMWVRATEREKTNAQTNIVLWKDGRQRSAIHDCSEWLAIMFFCVSRC
jgi:hypothetical protein